MMAVSRQGGGLAARVRRGVDRVLEGVVLLLMILLASVVIGGVMFRKFGAPLVWYDEVASIMLAWLTYYGASLAALRRAHIGFPLLVDMARPEMRRLLIVLREAVVVAFFGIVAWTGWMVILALEGFYLASLPWMSRQITQSVIPIGAVLFIVAELLSAGDELTPSEEPASPALVAQGQAESRTWTVGRHSSEP